MADLLARSPASGHLPLEAGDLRLREIDAGPMTALVPWAGREGDLDAALRSAHGLARPGPNCTDRAEGEGRTIWFDRRTTLLMGVAPDPQLATCAALVDQSDAWCVVDLSGAAARDVLARLVPIDLRDAAFPVGATARTQLMHLGISLTRTGPDTHMILGFRSMARTLVHDLKRVMEAVAAQG